MSKEVLRIETDAKGRERKIFKRGLNEEQVDLALGREQERSLNYLYRFDRLRLFELASGDVQEGDKDAQHKKPLPGDSLPIRFLFELHDQYLLAKQSGDQRSVIQLLKMLQDSIASADAKRQQAIQNLLALRKQVGKGLEGLSDEQLAELAKDAETA